MRPHRLLGLFTLITMCASRPFFAAPQNEQHTLGEALVANGLADLRSQFADCLDQQLAPTPNGQYLRAWCHINPSAGQLFVFSKELKLVRQLYGSELLVVPDGSIVYEHNQIYFAPTDSAEISIFNPATGREKQIYPPKPYQPARAAFIQRRSELSQQREEACFGEHRLQMDPARFDALVVVGSLRADAGTQSMVVTVQCGDPQNPNV